MLTRKAVACGLGRSGPSDRGSLIQMCRWPFTDVVDQCGSKKVHMSQVMLGFCSVTQAAGLVDGVGELIACE